ncbi:hypothetical protein HDU86_003279 [Geranomyces michiganensis]|nr:hypothetical protein HDU86_003279 [Geranomyces michiganensis]
MEVEGSECVEVVEVVDQRASSLVPEKAFAAITARFEAAIEGAVAGIPPSARALIEILETLCHKLPTAEEIAVTIGRSGTNAFLQDLSDTIDVAVREEEAKLAAVAGQSPLSDRGSESGSESGALEARLAVLKDLQQQALQLEPGCGVSQWMLEGIAASKRIANLPPNPTERTIDAYFPMPYAMLHKAQLRYGDGAPKADSDDKRRRSSANGAQRVDYNHFVKGWENASVAPSKDKVEGDFLAAIKVKDE